MPSNKYELVVCNRIVAHVSRDVGPALCKLLAFICKFRCKLVRSQCLAEDLQERVVTMKLVMCRCMYECRTAWRSSVHWTKPEAGEVSRLWKPWSTLKAVVQV